MATIWSVLSDRLTGDTILTAQLAPITSNPLGSIFYGRQPAHTTMAYVEFFCPDPHSNLQLVGPATTGTPYVETIRCQINIFTSADPVANNSIAKRIGQLLDPPATNLLSPSDAIVLSQMRASPLDYVVLDPKASESADDVWHGILLYDIKLQRTW
jgi:hypothetical protein